MPASPFPRRASLFGIAVSVSLIGAGGVAAQQTAAPGPAVGQMAPVFAVQGATRHGILRDSIRLSEFRGKTVVLAFFFKARTKG